MATGASARLVVKNSPAAELALAVFQPLEHAEFVPMLRQMPSVHGAAELCAVLTNRSPHRVTALVAQWSYVDHRKIARLRHVIRDSYSPIGRWKALEPGERLLVTLGGMTRAFDMSRPYASASSGNNYVHAPSDFTVGIDSAVFEDARIVGADAFHIANYIHGRHAAMKWVAEQVMVAEAAGEDVAAALASIVKSDARNEEQRWRRRLASLARRHPATAKSWWYLPKPPQFFRSH